MWDKTINFLTEHPMVKMAIASLPPAISEVLSDVQEMISLSSKRIKRVVKTDVKNEQTQKGILALVGNIEGGKVQGALAVQGSINKGRAQAINLFLGDVKEGELRGINLLKGRVNGGKSRGINIILGDIHGGDHSMINALVGDIYGGNLQTILLIGDIHGGEVKAQYHIGNDLRESSQAEKNDEKTPTPET